MNGGQASNLAYNATRMELESLPRREAVFIQRAKRKPKGMNSLCATDSIDIGHNLDYQSRNPCALCRCFCLFSLPPSVFVHNTPRHPTLPLYSSLVSGTLIIQSPPKMPKHKNTSTRVCS